MTTLRVAWPSPAAVAATSRSVQPIRVAMPVQPLGWRGTSPALVKIHARRRDLFHFHCQKGVDSYPAPEPEPEPEPELDNYRLDVMASPGNSFVDLIPANSDDPCLQELRKYHEAYCAATGMRVAPDMFPDDKDKISGYMIKISSSRVAVQNVKNKVMALTVCAQVQTALDLASIVMDLTDIASLDLGTAEFSQHTLNQMIRMYTPIFCNVAEDTYRKGIKRDAVLSFLDALKSLVTICHVLTQDTVAMLEDCHPSKNMIAEEIERRSHEYNRKAMNLKQEFSTAAFEDTVVMEILFDGIKQAQLYIFEMIQRRTAALGILLLKKARKLQEALSA